MSAPLLAAPVLSAPLTADSLTAGQWLLIVVVPLALAFGLYRAAVDGRFRGTHRVRGAEGGAAVAADPGGVLARTAYAEELGARATLLQFSSSFCAPCRTTRVLLAQIAAEHPDVAHVEIDAEHHLELVRALGVTRTPTTLVLDESGHEVARAAGVPPRAQVLNALGIAAD